jgi:hypothetical protein
LHGTRVQTILGGSGFQAQWNGKPG